jgi:uncharacterized SAM-binding protein YcdF (DUF218 family)
MVGGMPFDALVLLGCRVGQGPLVGAGGRRVRRTAEAYHAGLGRVVLVTGGREWGGELEANMMARALRQQGVPDAVLHLERRSLTTLENARYSAPVLAELGVKTVGLVSCDWHMRRALWCFRRVGVKAEPLPAPSGLRGLRLLGRVLRERGAWLFDGAALLAR